MSSNQATPAEINPKLQLMRQVLSDTRAKIEETFVVPPDDRLENLSFDPRFPHTKIEGRLRTVSLER